MAFDRSADFSRSNVDARPLDEPLEVAYFEECAYCRRQRGQLMRLRQRLRHRFSTGHRIPLSAAQTRSRDASRRATRSSRGPRCREHPIAGQWRRANFVRQNCRALDVDIDDVRELDA